MDEIIDVLTEKITKNLLKDPKMQLERTEPLISSGMLDSFNLVDLALIIEDLYGVRIEDFELTASLNEYQGQVVRLAVRHHNIVGLAASMSLNSFAVEPDTTISVPSHEMQDYAVFANGLQLSIRGAEGHSLQLYDMMGRLLLTRRSADGTYQLPAPGVYILRVDGFRPRKVVVVR